MRTPLHKKLVFTEGHHGRSFETGRASCHPDAIGWLDADRVLLIFGNDGAITGAGYTRLGKAVSNAAVSSLQRD